jgi:hypothetical protein
VDIDDPDRQHLVRRMARLIAVREQVKKAREAARERAKEQLDTMPQAIGAATDHLRQGKGGILTQRYLKTRLTERARLEGAAYGGTGGEEG